MNGSALFVVNLIATWYMVGLIWMVQIVHYNLFDRVGLEQFQQYEADHNRLITPIVGVPMLFELATAVLLLVAAPDSFPRWAAIVGLVLIGLIWLSTVMLQIPCHTQLLNGFDEATYRRLVNGNWIRTGLWTVRGGLMAYYAVIAIR
ncbi:MAG: hypothetical protein ACR2OA_17700 [Rubripirellula sp.]|jgi:hypothetical protein